MNTSIKKVGTMLCLVGAVIALRGATVNAAPNEDAINHPRTAYFTVGDYQDLPYTPLDSKASIESAFDVMHRLYDVKRVWWRGGQDEVWGKQFEIRGQSRRYERLWTWWMDNQYRVVNTNAIAVKAGHDRGMEVWMAYGLFDNGSPADVGFGGFPYAAEDKLRIEHPEWAPINKYGTWKQGGPIEFAYPEARKAMVDYLTKYLVEGKYDGIAFLTYVENYSMRYEDEFGFSPPIVEEFKRRHGVDIRTEPFDHDAWAKLRGEYLTQFMRELHASLSAHKIKIAISPDGKQPNLPCLWNVDGGVRTVGRLWLDLETWVKEGIVDELSPYYPNTAESLDNLNSLCKTTGVVLSAWGHTGDDKMPNGCGRIMTIGNELESGFDWAHRIDFPDEVVPAQPAESFTSRDVDARRRIVTAIAKGKQKASGADIVALLNDVDLYVRRGALRALATLKDQSTAPAVEKALRDPENGVRWLAATVLSEINAPGAMKAILDASARDESTYQFNLVILPELVRARQRAGTFSAEDASLLIAATASPVDKTREAAWYSIRALALNNADMERAVMRALTSDSDAYCREQALAAIPNLTPKRELIDAVVTAIKSDRDVVVQNRACMTLAALVRTGSALADEERDRALTVLSEHFRTFGNGCVRSDKDWGWRETGNALRVLGKPGESVLLEMMADHADKQLAELAWRVLYLRQEDGFCFVTEEEDRIAHSKHPFLRFGPNASAK